MRCVELFVLLVTAAFSQTPAAWAQNEVTLSAVDGVRIFGTFYPAPNPSAPIILLFHQSGSNRWEYAPIYPAT